MPVIKQNALPLLANGNQAYYGFSFQPKNLSLPPVAVAMSDMNKTHGMWAETDADIGMSFGSSCLNLTDTSKNTILCTPFQMSGGACPYLVVPQKGYSAFFPAKSAKSNQSVIMEVATLPQHVDSEIFQCLLATSQGVLQGIIDSDDKHSGGAFTSKAVANGVTCKTALLGLLLFSASVAASSL